MHHCINPFPRNYSYYSTYCKGIVDKYSEPRNIITIIIMRSARIWCFNKFGRLAGYSLVLTYYLGTGKLWQIERFDG